MLSNLIAQIQMFIDRIFLGRMNILYMSAVGNVTAPIWTTMSFVMSLAIGASILISQSVGEKDMDKAKEFAASMIKFSNVLPVLLFFFWTFCSPLVFKLMGVSQNVLKLCVIADGLEHLGQFEFVDGLDPARDLPQYAAHAVVVVQVVAAEAGDAGDLVREVEVVFGEVFFPAVVGVADLLHDVAEALGVENVVLEHLQIAVDARLGRIVDRQVQVGTADIEHVAQVTVDDRFVFHIRWLPVSGVLIFCFS